MSSGKGMSHRPATTSTSRLKDVRGKGETKTAKSRPPLYDDGLGGYSQTWDHGKDSIFNNSVSHAGGGSVRGAIYSKRNLPKTSHSKTRNKYFDETQVPDATGKRPVTAAAAGASAGGGRTVGTGKQRRSLGGSASERVLPSRKDPHHHHEGEYMEMKGTHPSSGRQDVGLVRGQAVANTGFVVGMYARGGSGIRKITPIPLTSSTTTTTSTTQPASNRVPSMIRRTQSDSSMTRDIHTREGQGVDGESSFPPPPASTSSSMGRMDAFVDHRPGPSDRHHDDPYDHQQRDQNDDDIDDIDMEWHNSASGNRYFSAGPRHHPHHHPHTQYHQQHGHPYNSHSYTDIGEKDGNLELESVWQARRASSRANSAALKYRRRSDTQSFQKVSKAMEKRWKDSPSCQDHPLVQHIRDVVEHRNLAEEQENHEREIRKLRRIMSQSKLQHSHGNHEDDTHMMNKHKSGKKKTHTSSASLLPKNRTSLFGTAGNLGNRTKSAGLNRVKSVSTLRNHRPLTVETLIAISKEAEVNKKEEWKKQVRQDHARSQLSSAYTERDISTATTERWTSLLPEHPDGHGGDGYMEDHDSRRGPDQEQQQDDVGGEDGMNRLWISVSDIGADDGNNVAVTGDTSLPAPSLATDTVNDKDRPQTTVKQPQSTVKLTRPPTCPSSLSQPVASDTAESPISASPPHTFRSSSLVTPTVAEGVFSFDVVNLNRVGTVSGDSTVSLSPNQHNNNNNTQKKKKKNGPEMTDEQKNMRTIHRAKTSPLSPHPSPRLSPNPSTHAVSPRRPQTHGTGTSRQTPRDALFMAGQEEMKRMDVIKRLKKEAEDLKNNVGKKMDTIEQQRKRRKQTIHHCVSEMKSAVATVYDRVMELSVVEGQRRSLTVEEQQQEDSDMSPECRKGFNQVLSESVEFHKKFQNAVSEFDNDQSIIHSALLELGMEVGKYNRSHEQAMSTLTPLFQNTMTMFHQIVDSCQSESQTLYNIICDISLKYTSIKATYDKKYQDLEVEWKSKMRDVESQCEEKVLAIEEQLRVAKEVAQSTTESVMCFHDIFKTMKRSGGGFVGGDSGSSKNDSAVEHVRLGREYDQLVTQYDTLQREIRFERTQKMELANIVVNQNKEIQQLRSQIDKLSAASALNVDYKPQSFASASLELLSGEVPDIVAKHAARRRQSPAGKKSGRDGDSSEAPLMEVIDMCLNHDLYEAQDLRGPRENRVLLGPAAEETEPYTEESDHKETTDANDGGSPDDPNDSQKEKVVEEFPIVQRQPMDEEQIHKVLDVLAVYAQKGRVKMPSSSSEEEEGEDSLEYSQFRSGAAFVTPCVTFVDLQSRLLSSLHLPASTRYDWPPSLIWVQTTIRSIFVDRIIYEISHNIRVSNEIPSLLTDFSSFVYGWFEIIYKDRTRDVRRDQRATLYSGILRYAYTHMIEQLHINPPGSSNTTKEAGSATAAIGEDSQSVSSTVANRKASYFTSQIQKLYRSNCADVLFFSNALIGLYTTNTLSFSLSIIQRMYPLLPLPAPETSDVLLVPCESLRSVVYARVMEYGLSRQTRKSCLNVIDHLAGSVVGNGTSYAAARINLFTALLYLADIVDQHDRALTEDMKSDLRLRFTQAASRRATKLLAQVKEESEAWVYSTTVGTVSPGSDSGRSGSSSKDQGMHLSVGGKSPRRNKKNRRPSVGDMRVHRAELLVEEMEQRAERGIFDLNVEDMEHALTGLIPHLSPSSISHLYHLTLRHGCGVFTFNAFWSVSSLLGVFPQCQSIQLHAVIPYKDRDYEKQIGSLFRKHEAVHVNLSLDQFNRLHPDCIAVSGFKLDQLRAKLRTNLDLMHAENNSDLNEDRLIGLHGSSFLLQYFRTRKVEELSLSLSLPDREIQLDRLCEELQMGPQGPGDTASDKTISSTVTSPSTTPASRRRSMRNSLRSGAGGVSSLLSSYDSAPVDPDPARASPSSSKLYMWRTLIRAKVLGRHWRTITQRYKDAGTSRNLHIPRSFIKYFVQISYLRSNTEPETRDICQSNTQNPDLVHEHENDILSLRYVLTIISKLFWSASDHVLGVTDCGNFDFSKFIYEWYIHMYGSRRLALFHLRQLFYAIAEYAPMSNRVFLFGQLIGHPSTRIYGHDGDEEADQEDDGAGGKGQGKKKHSRKTRRASQSKSKRRSTILSANRSNPSSPTALLAPAGLGAGAAAADFVRPSMDVGVSDGSENGAALLVLLAIAKLKNADACRPLHELVSPQTRTAMAPGMESSGATVDSSGSDSVKSSEDGGASGRGRSSLLSGSRRRGGGSEVSVAVPPTISEDSAAAAANSPSKNKRESAEVRSSRRTSSTAAGAAGGAGNQGMDTWLLRDPETEVDDEDMYVPWLIPFDMAWTIVQKILHGLHYTASSEFVVKFNTKQMVASFNKMQLHPPSGVFSTAGIPYAIGPFASSTTMMESVAAGNSRASKRMSKRRSMRRGSADDESFNVMEVDVMLNMLLPLWDRIDTDKKAHLDKQMERYDITMESEPQYDTLSHFISSLDPSFPEELVRTIFGKILDAMSANKKEKHSELGIIKEILRSSGILSISRAYLTCFKIEWYYIAQSCHVSSALHSLGVLNVLWDHHYEADFKDFQHKYEDVIDSKQMSQWDVQKNKLITRLRGRRKDSAAMMKHDEVCRSWEIFRHLVFLTWKYKYSLTLVGL